MNNTEIEEFIKREKKDLKPDERIKEAPIDDRYSQRYLPGKWVKNIYRDALNHVRKKMLHFKYSISMDQLEREFIIRYRKIEEVESYNYHERQIRELRVDLKGSEAK